MNYFNKRLLIKLNKYYIYNTVVMDTNTLIEIFKVGIKSIFTAKKYDTEILSEDLSRILFIRNYLEESLIFVTENYNEIDTKAYFSELKNYALELFMEQCKEAIPNEEKNSIEFNLEEHQTENKVFFNYIFENLKYPE